MTSTQPKKLQHPGMLAEAEAKADHDFVASELSCIATPS
jgi:hypothetical protein